MNIPPTQERTTSRIKALGSSLINFSLRHLTSSKHYYDASKTQAAARKAGLSVPAYVEVLSDAVGDTERVIELLSQAAALRPHQRICEVGAGAGRYLDHLVRICQPADYEIYEVDDGWARYLKKTYSPVIIARPVDGESLRATQADSCGLTAAFGVFIYISPLKSLSYIREMARVTKPGGYIAFDFYPAESVSVAEVFDKWLPSKYRFASWLPEHLVLEILKMAGCEPVQRTRLDFVWSQPTLLVARKAIVNDQAPE